ncbi:MAG: DNA-formamidopyrimidine glycosylase family protein [Acidobacteriota bacterium]|nr:DNA-formamidopyrimidine glycosylase family protein [Acidobacteriota bacterium]
MPEGHVIHRLAAHLDEQFGGRQVAVSSPQGRFAAAARLINDSRLLGADAVGKHLLIDFSDARTIWVHLGLIGRFGFGSDAPPVKPQTLRLRIAAGGRAADLRGPQWCRLIDPVQRAEVVDSSGPDPLRPDADPQRAWRKLQATRRPIGAALMDQAIFAGVGNIFRAEVLYRHGIDPELPSNLLPRPVFDSVWADLVALMSYAVARGRIDTVRPEHTPEAMRRPERVDAHGGEVYVYRRRGEPCLACGTEVAGQVMAGRNLYWCPACQPKAAS